jgi:hypothetical protein
MRSRFLATAAALAISGATLLATNTAASARWWGHGGCGGFAAGALVGGALASTAWAHSYGWYDPGYAYDDDYAYVPNYSYYGYAPGYSTNYSYGYSPRGYSYGYSPGYSDSYGYADQGGDVGYCMRRFRSYDRRSGSYLGFDGLRHPCP